MSTLVKLVGIEGPLQDKSRTLAEGQYSIGRSNCDISVPDAKVSAEHAVLRISNPYITIEDLGSLNGTYVNDAARENRVMYETLEDGDWFALGPNTAFGVRVLNLRPAGFWIRLFAILIDNLVVGLIFYAGLLFLAFITGFGVALGLQTALSGADAARSTGQVMLGILFWLWAICCPALYVVLMNGSRGQTLGKMSLGLKITRPDGAGISYGTAFLRYLMQGLLGTLSLGVLYLFLAAHPEKRGWHDLIADTRVVYAKELDGV